MFLFQSVFSAERRATMSAERQELTFGDISKVCALLSVLLRLSMLLLMHALHARANACRVHCRRLEPSGES